MPDNFHVDTSQIERLALDLGHRAVAVSGEARAVTKRGAQNIKNDWQAAWRGLSHAPSLAAAVSYDLTEHPWGVEAQVGPDKSKRQGALGNIVEYGTSKNAPHPGGGPALTVEEPRFAAELAKVIDKL